MASMSLFFSNYLPCSGKQKIKVVNGSFSSVAGQGSIHISPSLTLHFINLKYNILSIGRITKDLNCSIEFPPTSYYFQDYSMKTFGHDKL